MVDSKSSRQNILASEYMLIPCIDRLSIQVIYYFSWFLFPQTIEALKMVRYYLLEMS